MREDVNRDGDDPSQRAEDNRTNCSAPKAQQ